MALYGATGDYQAPPAKKTRQGNSKTQKLLQLHVMLQRRGIEVKENSRETL